MNLFEQLAAPFPPERVSWRVGSTTQDKKKGMALAYIDARDVMERLDAVCGPDGWERRHPHVAGTTTCELGLWVPARERWVVKTDGAGDTAVEAEKGSLSDSFKRAAVNWGIGRYLYDLPSPWVALNDRKGIEENERPKLEALLRRSAPPASAPSEIVTHGDEPAIALLRSYAGDQAKFKQTWDSNRPGWKSNLTPAEYGRVVAVMQEIAAKFVAPKAVLDPANVPEFA